MQPDEYNLEISRKYMEYVNPGLMRLIGFMGFDHIESYAEGSIIKDNLGHEYIDCLGGFGAYSIGHRHPKVLAAMRDQLDKIAFPSKVMLNEPLALLSEKLASITPGDLKYSFICNSGTEAVEGALKLARIKMKKPGVIYTQNAFHGKTLGSLSVTGREKYQQSSRPLLPYTTQIPFNDADALNDAIDEHTACFIVEPIQGEGGINIPSDNYLPKVREICDKKKILLIIDEVQTGLGRSGELFASSRWKVNPDLMTLAKALGGGLVPIGAIIGTPSVWEVFDDNPLIHSSTFGGNPLAARVALATLDVVIGENLPRQAKEKGEWLLPQLKEITSKYPQLINEVRGIGLFIGVDFFNDDIGGLMISALSARGVIVAFTLNSLKVIRIEPALNIPMDLLKKFLVHFKSSLEEISSIVGDLNS